MEDQPENKHNYSPSKERQDLNVGRDESQHVNSQEQTPRYEKLVQKEPRQTHDVESTAPSRNFDDQASKQYESSYQDRSNPAERQRPKYHSGKPNEDVIRKAQEFTIFVYMAIASLLGFRFILSLLGANQQSSFVSFIYDVTYPPLLPFDGMFNRDLYRPTGYTLEFEILVALLVYAVVFYGFNRLIAIIFD